MPRCHAMAILMLAAAMPAVELHLDFTAQPPEAVGAWYADATGRPATPVVVDQIDRTFTPAVVFAAPGALLQIRNSDRQQHNVFAYDERLHQDADLGLGQPGTVLARTVDWPVGEVLKHGCKIHPDMRLWVVCTTSPQAVGQRVERSQRSVALTLPDPAAPVRVWLSRGDAVTLDVGATVPLLLAGRPLGTATLHRAARAPGPGPDLGPLPSDPR